MSHDSTRKSFLTKVLGLTAGAVGARVVAAPAGLVETSPARGSAAAFPLRPDPRAVARREGAA